jgi:hypothetical protein
MMEEKAPRDEANVLVTGMGVCLPYFLVPLHCGIHMPMILPAIPTIHQKRILRDRKYAS